MCKAMRIEFLARRKHLRAYACTFGLDGSESDAIASGDP